MKTLRYTGTIKTTFVGVGEKEPGEVFSVADDAVGKYLPRKDIEEVTEDTPAEPVQDAAPRKGKAAKAVADEPTTDTETTAN